MWPEQAITPHLYGVPMHRLRRTAALAVAASVVAASVFIPAGAAVAAPLIPAEPITVSGNNSQTWTVPEGVTQVAVVVRGASGGDSVRPNSTYLIHGGVGAYVEGRLRVQPGDVLTLFGSSAGGNGKRESGSDSHGDGGSGWRNGGRGGNGARYVGFSLGHGGGGGGGASAIEVNGRVAVVAAGGGGAGGTGNEGGCDAHSGPGGDAGMDAPDTSSNFCTLPDRGEGGGNTTSDGHGAQGIDGRAGSGQSGGGGGGAGHRFSGGGGDASRQGGAGGGGGFNYVDELEDAWESLAGRGQGSVRIIPIYDARVILDEAHQEVYPGNAVVIDGSVAWVNPDRSAALLEGKEVSIDLTTVDGATTTVSGGTLDAEGRFAYSCDARCGRGEVLESYTVRISSDPTYVISAASGTVEFHQGSADLTLSAAKPEVVVSEPIMLTAVVEPVAPATGLIDGEVSFVAQLPDSTDTVELGTAPIMLVDGRYQAEFQHIPTRTGTGKAHAIYSGSDYYGPASSDEVEVLVSPADTATSVTLEPLTSVYGEQVVAHVQVEVVAPGTGVPQGAITLDGCDDCDVALDENGEAQIPLPASEVGSHEITVNYSGTTSYRASSHTASLSIQRAASAVTITADATESTFGEDLILTVSPEVVAPGSGEITGAYEVLVAGEVWDDVNWRAFFGADHLTATISDLPAGDHDIVVRFSGTDQFLPADSNILQHTVNPAPTSVEAQVLTPRVSVGGTTRIAVRAEALANVSISGEVVLTSANRTLVAPLVDGEAELSYRVETAEDEIFSVNYTGADNLSASTGAAVSVEAVPAASVMELSVEAESGADSASGMGKSDTQDRTLRIDLVATPAQGTPTQGWTPFAPSGTVQVLLNGEEIQQVDLVPGEWGASAVLTLSLAVGEHTIDAIYSGDERVEGSTANAEVTINAPDSGGPETPANPDPDETDKPQDSADAPQEQPGGSRLSSTGAGSTAVAMLGVMMMLAGVIVTTRVGRRIAADRSAGR